MIAEVMQCRHFDAAGGQTLGRVSWREGGVSILGAVGSMAVHQPGQLVRTEVALPREVAASQWPPGTFQPKLCCFSGIWFRGSLGLKSLFQSQ